MVDKKPAQSAPGTTAAKPANTPNTDAKPAATTTPVRPSLPSLTPITGAKAEAPDAQAPTPAVVPTSSEKAAPPASAELQPAAAPASNTATTEAKPATAPASPAKAEEKIGPKLRKRDEILMALRAGGKVEKIDGLFRIVNLDGTKNATSKRRILSLESQKLLVASADGKSYTLDVAADQKAREPKPVAAAKPTTEEKK